MLIIYHYLLMSLMIPLLLYIVYNYSITLNLHLYLIVYLFVYLFIKSVKRHWMVLWHSLNVCMCCCIIVNITRLLLSIKIQISYSCIIICYLFTDYLYCLKNVKRRWMGLWHNLKACMPCLPVIFSSRVIMPSSKASGLGGQPGI